MNVLTERVDDAELELALGDLELARTFKEAADNFLEFVQRIVRPDGFTPSPAALADLHKAETMLAEMECKIASAEKRIEQVLKKLG